MRIKALRRVASKCPSEHHTLDGQCVAARHPEPSRLLIQKRDSDHPNHACHAHQLGAKDCYDLPRSLILLCSRTTAGFRAEIFDVLLRAPSMVLVPKAGAVRRRASTAAGGTLLVRIASRSTRLRLAARAAATSAALWWRAADHDIQAVVGQTFYEPPADSSGATGD